MILRAFVLFLVMVFALAGMFSGNNNVISAETKPIVEKKMPELKDWSPSAQELAKQLMIKYGMPGEFTESMLIWRNNGPWKKTILFKDEMQHNFPFPHTDVLEQTMFYRVPQEKFNDLSRFNGSITASRTNGTLTVCCMNENLNILAINLAYNIIKGTSTASEARLVFYKNAAEIKNGKIPENAQHLLFRSEVTSPDPR